ncbi:MULTISPECIES: hypothetical protein [Fischerella]|jgi:hypothetical protein|uniref:Uncharacterized protein n=1 Tax=Fischerella thermalis JSC-11 TaxID=741277 RepID=G6FXR2_9CYAN|nr:MULTISPECIES: hypothetical protein [Fischerella]EHC10124.1 hypothetical protein FJSC11DRAFT_3661 [Fischerella thermalis JSC-11]
MLEKLLLAITITFSLNLFLQVHLPEESNSGANLRQLKESAPVILVRLPQK